MYYINLRNTAEVPSWTLGTLPYHEGIPGHHLQLSIQQEAKLALIRKVSFFSAISKGGLSIRSSRRRDGHVCRRSLGSIGYMHDAMFGGGSACDVVDSACTR